MRSEIYHMITEEAPSDLENVRVKPFQRLAVKYRIRKYTAHLKAAYFLIFNNVREKTNAKRKLYFYAFLKLSITASSA